MLAELDFLKYQYSSLNGRMIVVETSLAAGGGGSLALYAPLASPVFTGTPSLPTGTIAVTQATGSNTTAIATTAFVKAQAYATLASPTFTGTPTLPTGTIAVTQTSSDNTTAVATTAFVKAQAYATLAS